MSTTTRLFKSNTTQAVRLPKDVAFPEGVTEVEIRVVGDARLILPKGRGMAHWLKYGRRFPDFPEREQPPMQERSWLD
ncbi:MAG: type II toxin-antitoxin system VapB family antitoxin [Marmoricola sp.]|jgi:antitoxin VapB